VRILVVSNLYPPVVSGGYELECAAVVDHLRERHEVCVLTSSRDRGDAPPDATVRRELRFMRYGPTESLQAPLAALHAARVTRRVLRSFRPELLFVWNGASIPQVTLRLLERSGLPVVYSVMEHWFAGLYRADQFMRHLYGDDTGLRAVWARVVRAVNRLPALRVDVEQITPVSIAWVSDRLRELGPAPPTVAPVLERTLYPASPKGALFAARPREPTAAVTLLFAGRVEQEKGIDVAYRALALLRDRHGIRARLVVAGPWQDEMHVKLARLADELGIGDDVDVRGALDTEELGDLYASAHAIVIPPVWQEPAPLICVEAALARIPIVASRSGGIPELLHDGEHALLFEIGDAEACADALAETLRDPASTAARVTRAFERGEQLSLDRYLEETDRFLEDSIAALGHDRDAARA
jgi:glycogen(starch) synthase